ncbi:MAG TPA: tetratricopeptide repeat protein [Bacillota bacterium]|nr:tetratricopeptide repeat protein [Bacillota bacterium]
MFATFTAIFEALNAIENELAADTTESQREKLIETLLSLRKTMDKCVQYWLKFEERVNEIQERYSITLPDTLPPGFLDEVNLDEDELAEAKAGSTKDKQAPAEGDDGEAEDIPDQFTRPVSEITVNSFRRGLGFWELAMLKEAVAEFKKVVEEEPDLTMGHFCLGLSSAQLGKVEEAFKELKLVLALDQNKQMRALALNTLGIIQTEKEQYQQARLFFEKAIEADPQLSEAWFNLAATSYNMQDYEAAVQYFEKARELTPEDWEIELHLGRARGYLGQYEEAAETLERAYRLNPREPLITFELGLIFRLLGKTARAQCYFHATLKLMEGKK